MKKILGIVLVLWVLTGTGPVFPADKNVFIVAPDGAKLLAHTDVYALVVAVGDYLHFPKRPGVSKDAGEVADALRGRGCQVELLENPSASQLRAALENLVSIRGASPNRALLFYFAGYGLTFKDKDGTSVSFLLPRDCPSKLADPKGFDALAVSMKEVEALSAKSRARQFLLLFDANLTGADLEPLKPEPRSLTAQSVLPVRQFIFAGAPGDSQPGHSAFQESFLKALSGAADINVDGFVIGSELAKYLRVKVSIATDGGQIPHYAVPRNQEFAQGDFIFEVGALPFNKDDLPDVDTKDLFKKEEEPPPVSKDGSQQALSSGSRSADAAAKAADATGPAASAGAANVAGAAASAGAAATAGAAAAAGTTATSASATAASIEAAATVVESAAEVAKAAALKALAPDEISTVRLKEEQKKLEEERAKLEQERLKVEEEKRLIAEQKASLSAETARSSTTSDEVAKLEQERLKIEEEKRRLEKMKAELEATQAALTAQAAKQEAMKAQSAVQVASVSKPQLPPPLIRLRAEPKVITNSNLLKTINDDMEELVEKFPSREALTAPDRFVDNGNGTVSDKVTGLIWQKGLAKRAEFGFAVRGLEAANRDRLGGSASWRLPTTDELLFLYRTMADVAAPPLDLPRGYQGLWSADPAHIQGSGGIKKALVYVWDCDALFGRKIEGLIPEGVGSSFTEHLTKVVRTGP